MTLKETFFEDLSRHLQTWRDDIVEAVADPVTAAWSDSQQAYERLQAKSFSAKDLEDLRAVLDECLRGLLHSTLVTIDGGTALSRYGGVVLVDAATGEQLTTGALHEEFIEFLVQRGLA